MSLYTLVDGVEADTIPATDSSVLRGDGCFESIRSYDGVLFALGWHLDRMERSARLLGLDPPPRALIEEWCRKVGSVGDGVIRVLLTRGDVAPTQAPAGRCIVMHLPVAAPPSVLRLCPVVAPWHPAGRDSELAGAKTLSYAPNLAASRLAESQGFHDALLVADDGLMLEGPTFSVGWVVRGVLETPPLDLHILDSITRRMVLEAASRIGLEVLEPCHTLDRLDDASEVMAWSTVKEVTPVTAVGDRRFEPGPVAKRLGSVFRDLVGEDRGG